MKIEQKISKAKAKLLIQYPYFGTLASKLRLVKNDDVEAFKSDGKILEYSSNFIENAQLNEIEFILANGAMHITLSHQNRRNGRSGWLWQMATDIAINDMLTQNGLNRPDEAQYHIRFKNMYAEEIYAELKDDILRDELEYEADDIQADSQSNKELFQEEILSSQLQEEEALEILKKEYLKEEFPKSIERFFTLDFNSKINWRDELKSAIDRYLKNDFTLLPPNKKFLSQGIYLPSTISQTFRLVIAIDSSGSIDEKQLKQFLSEINFLMSFINNYQIEILICDEQIQSHQTFFTGDSLDVEIKGGNGTDFRPVFHFIEENFDDLKLVLYFSDLNGIFPEKTPNYEVKWVTQEEKKIPFGEIIFLD